MRSPRGLKPRGGEALEEDAEGPSLFTFQETASQLLRYKQCHMDKRYPLGLFWNPSYQIYIQILKIN
jgi:hypothetical protein